MDQKQFGAGGRRPHRMRGVLLSFNEGDAGRTDVRLCAEQPLVSPDIPMVRRSLSREHENAERDVGTYEQQPPKTRNTIKE